MKISELFSYLNDDRVRRIIAQVSLAGFVVFCFWWLITNTSQNLDQLNKTIGFDFLFQNAGFQIAPTLGTWLFSYEVGSSTYWDIYLIGIINTLLIAVLGIFAATIIGFLIGIMRLSNNLIFRSFATVYIEVLRNIPLLLQLFFWYFTVLRSLPDKRGKIDLIPGAISVNLEGLFLPYPIWHSGAGFAGIVLLVATIATMFMRRKSKNRQLLTGHPLPIWRITATIFAAAILMILVSVGIPMEWSQPTFIETGSVIKRGFDKTTAILVIPEMLAVWFALTLYTAAFIAENVRSGILAVSKGQAEAASSLGLSSGQTLRLVVIPQALRVIVPPLTSQYLNLTKNSSLAVAIAYPELVSIFAGTAMNQVGKEIEMFFMMMMVYLTFSLLTSAFMNWFNHRSKLAER
ncbi:MAG: ABC transporter permease subunit [Alphaproteobacteria bacterium]|nr:ABC transporter permease subunit [Alphaproteobacteria bacterium]